MKFFRLAVLASLPLLSSCALLVGTEESTGKAGQSTQSLHALQKTEQQEVLRGAKLRLASIRRQIAVGKFTEAEADLAPLANSSLYPEEVAELSAKISAGREKAGVLRVRKQIALARRLAYKDDFDEAEAMLNMQDANGPCKVEIREVRELLNLRRIKRSSRSVGKQVTEIRRAIKRGELAAADALLDGLESSNTAAPQVAALRLELRAAQDGETLSIAQQATVNQALSEVEDRLVLPPTYGKTIVISPNLDPLEMPVGSMEDLINKKVSIELDNAGVKELVQVLSEQDGLNVIADDALEAEKTLTINVKQVPLKEILSYIARNMGVAFHMGENIIWVTESTEEPGTGPQLETRVFQLRHGFVPALKPKKKQGEEGGEGDASQDTDLEDSLDAFLADSPEGASYRVFKTRNVLIVKDSRENLRLVEELVRTFDKPPLQVSIEARFLTISEDDLLDVGAEFSAGPDDIPTIGEDAESMTQITALLSSLGAITEGNEAGIGGATFDGVIGNRAYNLIISAIKRRDSTKNLSAPQVTLLNGQTARMRRGNTTLYYSELDTVAGDGGDTTGDSSVQTAFTGDPEELETGVTLEVKVNIGNNGETILLGLLPEIIELTRWRSFNVVAEGGSSNNNNSDDSTGTNAPGTIELPETSDMSVQTAVAVKSGQTVTLGGLVTTTVQKTVSKVPILGDIPLIGFFFRHTNEKNVPQHLIIFVTATVIDSDGSFVQVAK